MTMIRKAVARLVHDERGVATVDLVGVTSLVTLLTVAVAYTTHDNGVTQVVGVVTDTLGTFSSDIPVGEAPEPGRPPTLDDEPI